MFGGRLHTVHPRGCGERNIRVFLRNPVRGSSPRVRGTRDHCLHRCNRFRFIPAGAGNATGHNQAIGPEAVHPRGCGERQRQGTDGPCVNGSSPRVRGTLKFTGERNEPNRFIPAGAGNAEKIKVSALAEGGSSPRVRGTPLAETTAIDPLRFIPAGAGNAQYAELIAEDVPVHPRGCGERVRLLYDHYKDIGSSPRVRGTLCDCR